MSETKESFLRDPFQRESRGKKIENLLIKNKVCANRVWVQMGLLSYPSQCAAIKGFGT